MKTFSQLIESVILIENLKQILSQKSERIRSNLIRDEISHEPGKHVEHFKSALENLPQHHQTWIAKRYANQSIQRYEDIGSRVVPALKKFDDLVSRGIAKPETLSKWKNPADLENFVRRHTPGEDLPEVDSSEYEKHAENEHWLIHIPHTENASCALGHGTNWCTASRTNSMFNNYNEKGPLYVITPKNPKYKGEKYQFHPEYGQFMNEEDSDDTKLLAGGHLTSIADKPAFADRPLPGAVGVYVSLQKHDDLDHSKREYYGNPNVSARLKEMLSRDMTKDEQIGLAHYLYSTSHRKPAKYAFGYHAPDADAIEHQKLRNHAVNTLLSSPNVHSEAKAYILPVAMKHIHDFHDLRQKLKLDLDQQESNKRATNRNLPREEQAHDEVIGKTREKIGSILREEVGLRKAAKSAIEDPNAHHRLLAAAIHTEGVQIPVEKEIDPYLPPEMQSIPPVLFPHFGVTEKILKQKQIHPTLQHTIADFSARELRNMALGDPELHPYHISTKPQVTAIQDHVRRLGDHPSLLPSTLRKLAAHERDDNFASNNPEIPRFTRRILQQPHLSIEDQHAIAPMGEHTYGRYYGIPAIRNKVIDELSKRELHPTVLKHILSSHVRNSETPHPAITSQMLNHIKTADKLDPEIEHHVFDMYHYLTVTKNGANERKIPYTSLFQAMINRPNPSVFVLNRIRDASRAGGLPKNAYGLHPGHGERIRELEKMSNEIK